MQKTQNVSFNLNIKVPFENVNLFHYVFSCFKVILTVEHYINLSIIVIWRFAMGFF